MPKPTTTATTRTATTQVTAFSGVGARSLLRARATARLLCRISWWGTTGKLPVGGPGVTPNPYPPGATVEPIPTLGTWPVWVKARRWSGPAVTAATTLVRAAVPSPDGGPTGGRADQASIMRRARASPSRPRKTA